NVEEGTPVVVDSIEYSGFDVVPARGMNALKNRVPLKTGAPLDRALAQASRETVLDAVKDHGYPYATVRLTERPGRNDHARILTMSATLGTLAKFGDVRVVGNKEVSTHIVERQLTFRPGDRFRLSQLQESQRRLYQLQTFQFANVETETKEGEQPESVP